MRLHACLFVCVSQLQLDRNGSINHIRIACLYYRVRIMHCFSVYVCFYVRVCVSVTCRSERCHQSYSFRLFAPLHDYKNVLCHCLCAFFCACLYVSQSHQTRNGAINHIRVACLYRLQSMKMNCFSVYMLVCVSTTFNVKRDG